MISDRDPPPPVQQPRDAGTVTGRVVDGGCRPVVGAVIAIVASERSVPIPAIGILTNDEGRYATISLPGGRYELTVSAEGFTSATKPVVVVAGAAAPLDFVLLPG